MSKYLKQDTNFIPHFFLFISLFGTHLLSGIRIFLTTTAFQNKQNRRANL